MRIETPRPSPREDGDYAVWVTMGYGDPDAIIHLAKNGTLDLRDVHADDCDRLIRAAARAKEEILRYQAMMAAPHGSRYLYQGTCQLCGKPADDPEALHGEPQRSALDCGCTIPGTVGPGVPVHCITHGNTAVALPAPGGMQDPAPVVRVTGEETGPGPTGLHPPVISHAGPSPMWDEAKRGFIAADSPVLRGAEVTTGRRPFGNCDAAGGEW